MVMSYLLSDRFIIFVFLCCVYGTSVVKTLETLIFMLMISVISEYIKNFAIITYQNEIKKQC